MPRRKREALPAWLKIYTDTRDMVAAAPCESLGSAVKGLFRLLTEPDYRGEDLELAALLLFLQLRRGTDESVRDYHAAVAFGKQGAARKNAPREEQLPTESVWADTPEGYYPLWEGMDPAVREAHRRLNEFQRSLETSHGADPVPE